MVYYENMLTKIDLKSISNLLDEKFKKELAPIKEDIVKIRKDQKIIVKFFDNEYLALRKRVERIESFLKLGTIN